MPAESDVSHSEKNKTPSMLWKSKVNEQWTWTSPPLPAAVLPDVIYAAVWVRASAAGSGVTTSDVPLCATLSVNSRWMGAPLARAQLPGKISAQLVVLLLPTPFYTNTKVVQPIPRHLLTCAEPNNIEIFMFSATGGSYMKMGLDKSVRWLITAIISLKNKQNKDKTITFKAQSNASF